MHKFYKQRLYKKYNDEIWGNLISSKKFSYNKKSVLLSYRDKIVRNRLRIRTKYRYYRKGFLKRLNYTSFQFKSFRRKLRVLNFTLKKKTSSKSFSLLSGNSGKNRLSFIRGGKRYTKPILNRRNLFHKTLLKKSLLLLKFNILNISSFLTKVVRLSKNRLL